MGDHYTRLAYNMVLSIKKFSDIKVAVITDSTNSELTKPFDITIEPKMCDYLEGYMFNPFKLKTYIYDYTPFNHTIYLDVDGMTLKDLTPLFDYSFKIQEVGKYDYSNAHTSDMVWTNKAGKRLNDIFDAYDLPKERLYPEYNSSIIVFKKSEENKIYFDKAKENYNDRRIDFKPIGGLYPDELAWNLASAQLEHYTETPSEKPIYFFWENRKDEGVNSRFYVLGMAGGFHNTKLKAVYETTMKQISPYWKFDSMKKIFHNKK